MKSFKSTLCVSILTLAMCSAAFAGDITSRKGDITSKPGDITSKPGDITSFTDEAFSDLLGVLSSILG